MYNDKTPEPTRQSIEMLGMAMLPFMMYLPKMAPHTALSLDTDWFYRKPFAGIVTGLSYLCCAVSRALGNTWEVLYEKSMELSHNQWNFWMPSLCATVPNIIRKITVLRSPIRS
jgi:multicomponent Na+:H+ antiporter subunit D